MKKTRKTGQIGDLIRGELSGIIARELRDPDIGFTTIVDVEVSADIRLARVYISVIGDEKTQKQTLIALKKASSRLRYMLAQRAALRNTPELEFRLDHTAEQADHIERALSEVNKKEQEDVDHTDDDQ